jgi:hypothetical protein
MIPGLVTTIIPVYNRAAQLREAVESVLLQDYRPTEIVIVDDGSTDDTLAHAQALAGQHPDIIRAATQANAGPGLARERGRQMAQGEFIQYLDSDDVLLPGKFAAQVGALTIRPDCDAAYGMTRFRHLDGTAEPGPWKGSGVARQAMFPAFLIDRWWDTPNPLYRAGVCERAGGWTDLRLEEDWEYDCRIAALGTQLVWCEQYVCEVRDHAGGRLCRGSARDAQRMAQRARSHELIFGHAMRAGLQGTPEMRHFARALFLLSRQCGAAGLGGASRRLFGLARQASGEARARGWDFRLYKVAASLLGWTLMGRLSAWLDKARK